jgi:hypothetical protein
MDEIASHIDRNREYARAAYVSVLVKEGMLRYIGLPQSPLIHYQTTDLGKDELQGSS